jgi:acyl carrier protein
MDGTIRDEIIKCLLEFTGGTEAPAFGDTSWIRDFGLDSLALFHFLLHLEKVFQLRFSEDNFSLESVESFDGLVDMVRARREQA